LSDGPLKGVLLALYGEAGGDVAMGVKGKAHSIITSPTNQSLSSLLDLLGSLNQLLHHFLELVAQEHSALCKVLVVRDLPLGHAALPIQHLQCVFGLVLPDPHHHRHRFALHLEKTDLHGTRTTVLPSWFLTGVCSP
jgi:hypothetical protein